MISGFDKSKVRRAWVVSDFLVWGMTGLDNVEYLALETVGAEKNVHFGSVAIGGTQQLVTFSSLCDLRGNNLPEEIDSPVVIVQPRSAQGAFIVGNAVSESFMIARDADASRPVPVDLLIMEMGS
ncbi:MAG: hypothetical protein KAT79_05195 [candidate division Zixibacteria bacterium]|nr:hypothetical protein [candidate division Zixibacteria bacterium]